MLGPAGERHTISRARVGDVLAGKYRIEHMLGCGGMGVVFAARHLALGERVAIKLLLPRALARRETVARFLQEGRAAARIRGEHGVRVHDVGTLEGGAPYLVMEYLEGSDLGAVLRSRSRCPLSIETAIDYVLQACLAVAEAHALGIVHRDLKPANLFLASRPDGSMTIKVLDFGISKIAGGEVDGIDGTASGATLGTPLYMAPEQMRSARAADARSDIWSIGAILHALLTGSPPSQRTSPAEGRARIAPGSLDLRSSRPDAPEGLEAALAKCLAHEPSCRYPSVDELAAALAHFGPPHGRSLAERAARVLRARVEVAGHGASETRELRGSSAVTAESEAGSWDETASAQSVSVPSLTIDASGLLAGKYRVVRVIGQGGMGLVVEAERPGRDERVAVKILLPEHASRPGAVERFLRGARAAAGLASEHAVSVRDVGTSESGEPFMEMELLEGRDLSQVLDAGVVLPIEDAVDCILQAAEAVDEAHAQGIVHRDLKPSNLFLTRRADGSPLVKVLDFGISKTSSAEGSGEAALTGASTVVGSTPYMPPEQMASARDVDHRADVYSLGIALFELLAGRPPFVGDSVPQLCVRILSGTPTPLRSLRPEVPEELAKILERAYARAPEARYPTVRELARALAPHAPPTARPLVDRISPEPSRSRSRRSTGLVAVLSAGAVLACLGSAIFLVPRMRSGEAKAPAAESAAPIPSETSLPAAQPSSPEGQASIEIPAAPQPSITSAPAVTTSQKPSPAASFGSSLGLRVATNAPYAPIPTSRPSPPLVTTVESAPTPTAGASEVPLDPPRAAPVDTVLSPAVPSAARPQPTVDPYGRHD